MIHAGREALLAVLTAAGIRAVENVPERITPPLSVIVPANDWVTAGDTFGTFRLGFDITIIVQTSANAVGTKALDDAVDAVLTAIMSAPGFFAAAVGSPTILSVQNAEFLSATLTVYQNTRL